MFIHAKTQIQRANLDQTQLLESTFVQLNVNDQNDLRCFWQSQANINTGCLQKPETLHPYFGFAKNDISRIFVLASARAFICCIRVSRCSSNVRENKVFDAAGKLSAHLDTQRWSCKAINLSACPPARSVTIDSTRLRFRFSTDSLLTPNQIHGKV